MNIKDQITLPEPDGKVYHEARAYEDGWVSSEDAYSESTVRALLAAAVAKERERCAQVCEERHANGNRKYTHADECAAAIKELK